MEWIDNKFKNTGDSERFTEDFSPEDIQSAYDFHTSMSQYESTALHELPDRAQSLGLSALYVKDESTRFGLNAFKGLGASYAMARYFAGQLNEEIDDMDFNRLRSALNGRPPETFVTATEGNHGKGVAWGAKIFKQQGRVFMPKGTAGARLQAVTEIGADAEVTEMNYDDTVQYAAEQAKRNGWVLMQDTAWEGYTEIPLNIMRGYTTIISEVQAQLGRSSLAEVSHVVLQAGVGSFAGAMAAALYKVTDGIPPKIIIVEPEAADPIFRSAASDSGKPVRVHGEMNTVMTGLSCGAPSVIGWDILKSTVDHFVSCDDTASDKGMRMYGRPPGEDPSIVSGASGAVPFGFLAEVMTNDKYSELKKHMELDESSKVLLFNTEGNTDPGNRRRVMESKEEDQ